LKPNRKKLEFREDQNSCKKKCYFVAARCSATGRAEFCRRYNGRVGCCLQTVKVVEEEHMNREHEMDSVTERITINADYDDDKDYTSESTVR